LFQVVSVDDADVIEAELLKQRAARDEAARELFGPQCALFQKCR